MQLLATLLQTYLLPSKQSLQYSIKMAIAMVLALYIALRFNLQRPYWALISAAFLQIIPMSGMVVEKGIAQITGTIIGGIAGLIIMGSFAQEAVPALFSICMWIMLCTYVVSLLNYNLNFSYGAIIAGSTAMLIMVFGFSQPDKIFSITVARVSELGLGEICATIVSALLWPVRVRDYLANQANLALNNTFRFVSNRMDFIEYVDAARKTLIATLEPLNLVYSGSNAARFEGVYGYHRMKAAQTFTYHAMQLFAVTNTINQMIKAEVYEINKDLKNLLLDISRTLNEVTDEKNIPYIKNKLYTFKKVINSYNVSNLTPLQRRIIYRSKEVIRHLLIMIEAYNAILQPRKRILYFQTAKSWHKDYLNASLNAIRVGVLFCIIATFWIQSSWSNGHLALMIGALFAIMFSRFDNPLTIGKMFFYGMIAAIPSAFIFGHTLLASTSGFPLFALFVITPLFLGILGSTNPKLRGYCLGFAIFNIMLTMPGNNMDFTFKTFSNRTVAYIIGIGCVLMIYRMIPGLGFTIRIKRLIKSICNDLRMLNTLPVKDAEANFVGRMTDRLFRLIKHDDVLPEEHRYLSIVGLNGLDLGVNFLRMRKRLEKYPAFIKEEALNDFINVAITAFEESIKGKFPTTIEDAVDILLSKIGQYEEIDDDYRLLWKGFSKRLEITLTQQANLALKGKVNNK